MKLRIRRNSLGEPGFSLMEMMIGATIFGVVMASVYTTNNALISSMTASENYSVGQLQAMDYISLDLRRANSLPTFGTDHGTLTLPLKIYLPQYYQADGHSPNPPQRVLVSSLNKKDKKKHKVFDSLYYYYYGSLTTGVLVTYDLVNGNLTRKEGSLATRVVGSGISSVTFGPTETAIAADPVVTTTISFNPTRRSKQAPPPLSSSTFMREYYYSDYKLDSPH
jgi:prepilin-type N-terminal cleavage/methylation domain-containing protein